jgi:hypothetical protein
MPFKDVVGNGAKDAPAHIDATLLNVSVVGELTVTVNVVIVAHCPEAGVKM